MALPGGLRELTESGSTIPALDRTPEFWCVGRWWNRVTSTLAATAARRDRRIVGHDLRHAEVVFERSVAEVLRELSPPDTLRMQVVGRSDCPGLYVAARSEGGFSVVSGWESCPDGGGSFEWALRQTVHESVQAGVAIPVLD